MRNISGGMTVNAIQPGGYGSGMCILKKVETIHPLAYAARTHFPGFLARWTPDVSKVAEHYTW